MMPKGGIMKKFNKIVIAVLTLCFVFALTGCSDKKAEKKYTDDVLSTMNNATSANSSLITDIQTFLNDVTNEDARKTVLEDLNTMEAEFTTLRDLSAPKRYKEAQEIFKEGAEQALNGITSYRSAIESCSEETTKSQEAYDAFSAVIEEGDTYMTTANSKIMEAVKIADETK
jgi:uncharacterized lipoprotein YehR (DUF1307 family)